MKDNYTFGKCKQCGEWKALKNGYCIECGKDKIDINDFFGGIFGDNKKN